jgi:serine/threonine-protein kinase
MDADPLIGRTLARRFRLDRCIGRGGMATVYAAFDEKTSRDVAVKVLKRELSRDPMVTKRFEREAKAAAKLDHPNTIRIVDHGVDGAEAFIAMELASGRDLLKALGEERPMGQKRAALIGAQICDALEAAHEMGIVHRDLKPENVMLVTGPGGPDHVKVLDFGIAKIMEAKPVASRADADDPPSYITQTALTRAGTIVGTPAYMSPEQCRGGELDRRSDLYACGVLLYQLLTAELPFTGETPLHTAMRHIHAQPRPPSELRADLDPALERTVLKALAKSPGDRQQSAAELSRELRAIAATLPGPSTGKPYDAPPPDARDGAATEGTSQLVGGPLGGTPLRAVRLGGPVAVPVGRAADVLLEPSSDERAASDGDDDDEPRTFLMKPEDTPTGQPTPALPSPAVMRRTLVGVAEAMGAASMLSSVKRPAERASPGDDRVPTIDEWTSQVTPPPSHPRAPTRDATTRTSEGDARKSSGGAAKASAAQRAPGFLLRTQRSRTTTDAAGPTRSPSTGAVPAARIEARPSPTTSARPPGATASRVARTTETGLTPTHVGRPIPSAEPSDELGNSTFRMAGHESVALAEAPRESQVEAGDSDDEPRTFIRASDDAKPNTTTLVMEESSVREPMAQALGAAPPSVVIDASVGAERADPLRALRATAPVKRSALGEHAEADNRLQQLRATMKMPARGIEGAEEGASAQGASRAKQTLASSGVMPTERAQPQPPSQRGAAFGDTGSGVVPSPFRSLPASGWTEPTQVTKPKPTPKPRGVRLLDELPGTMGLLIGIGIGLGIAAGAVIAVILWR